MSERKGISRRALFRGAGATAVGTALLESGIAAAAEKAVGEEARVIGPAPLPVKLTVNGHDVTVNVDPATTLADVLRTELQLTGTKIGCDRGACSGCTVHVDGQPHASCMTFALDVRGKKITTIEGLASGDKLHPVQDAFIKHDALQCGFCTPGMIMSCAALCEQNKNPTLDDVKTCISGHLCRCGTYQNVFDAVLSLNGNANNGKAGA
jgi:aerobic-type carbon monoxide dehydrogenase small subunit (CoxS/CutS family)